MDFKALTIEKTDGELLLACRNGDEKAWTELVHRFQRLVAAVPRRAGLSEDLTAEVFQEVFLALFEKMHEIEQPERVRAWLVTTAKFKTWRMVSREKVGQKTLQTLDDEDDANFSEIADTSPLTDEVLIELEEQHTIRTAVDSLDERCRQIINLLYLQDESASYSQVAAKVGVGETSVSPLRARCLKKMMKLLQK